MSDEAKALHLLMARLAATEAAWEARGAEVERLKATLRRVGDVATRPADVRSLVAAALGDA